MKLLSSVTSTHHDATSAVRVLIIHRIIQDLVAEILSYSGALYTASEAVCFPEHMF